MDILFKAKRLDNGEWIECGSIVQFMDDRVRSVFIPDRSMPCNCLHDEYTDNIESCSDFFLVKVDPETVCQYTGLNDKNGVEIFEGDIVRFAEWKDGEMCWIGELIYQYGLFAIKGGPNKECDCDFFVQLSRVPSERIEVIGNKYDKEYNNAE